MNIAFIKKTLSSNTELTLPLLKYSALITVLSVNEVLLKIG